MKGRRRILATGNWGDTEESEREGKEIVPEFREKSRAEVGVWGWEGRGIEIGEREKGGRRGGSGRGGKRFIHEQ